MKRFLLSTTFLFSAIFTLSAETIFMKAGSKTFELEVQETVCGKDFLRFVKDKYLKMQKYGGFEFYVYENLKTSNETLDSKYEKRKCLLQHNLQRNFLRLRKSQSWFK